jgi:hypothetical protein
MPLAITCPDCENVNQVADDKPVRKIKCRMCGGSFTPDPKLWRGLDAGAKSPAPANTETTLATATTPTPPANAEANMPAESPKDERKLEEKRPRSRRRDLDEDDESPRERTPPPTATGMTSNQKVAASAGGAVLVTFGLILLQVTNRTFVDKAVNDNPSFAASPGEMRPLNYKPAEKPAEDPPRVNPGPDPEVLRPFQPDPIPDADPAPKKAETPPVKAPKRPKSDPVTVVVAPRPPVRPQPPKEQPKPESEFDKRLRGMRMDHPSRFDIGWFASQPLDFNRRREVARAIDACCKSSDQWVAYDAAGALQKWGDSESIKPLVDLYNTVSEGAIRHRIVETLGNLRDAKSSKALVLIMRTHPEHRRTAADSLRRLGRVGETDVQTLLNDAEPELVREGCRILNNVGTSDSLAELEALIGRCQSKLKDGHYREIVAEAGRAIVAIKARAN